jgi:hypothetical protein
MPRQRTLESNVDPSSTSQIDDNVPTGNKLMGFLATFTGTNASGQSLGQEDLGTVIVEIYERQRINLDIGFTVSYPRIHHGDTDQESVTGGNIDLVSFVPLGYAHEPNAIPVRRTSDVRYSYNFDDAAISTDASSISFDLRAVYAPRVALRYIPEWRQSTFSFNSGTTDDEEYTSPDLTDIYLREAAANANSDIIDNVRITQDNTLETDTVTDDEIEDLSVILEESAAGQGEPWSHQNLMDGPVSAGGFENSQTELEITTNDSGDVLAVRHIRRPAE